VGDSFHSVAKSTDAASVYEVNTPSGVGRAKGTEFQVSVSALIVQFLVTEGIVEVSNVNVVVVVLAGYTTVIDMGAPPAPPALTLTGEGEVQLISADMWRIADQNFAVNAATEITGEPQVGDWVAFEGRQLADGTRVADTITLLKRRITNTFTFIGTVEVISDTSWTITGKTVFVDELTEIEAGLQVGNIVEVQGGIAADGTFWASSIELFESMGGETFTLEGVVQSISNPVWAVSGFTFTVDVSTTIAAGIVEGDLVRVQGEILESGERRAFSVEKLANGDETEFSFVGIVISTEPWNVSGVPLETDAETEIEAGIRVGNRVRVSGRLLTDGTYIATEIEQLDNGARHAIIFTARVESIEPWVVGGVTVTVDSKTKIDAEIEVGDLVTVKGNLLPDGTVLAKKITRVSTNLGCVSSTQIVVAFDGSNTITLSNGQTVTLDTTIPVTGQIQVASVVIVQTCVGEEGQIIIVAIIVISQLDELPTPTPTATPMPTPVSGCTSLLVITNGQVTFPSGTFITMGGQTIALEVELKDDKSEVKLVGQPGNWEVKVEVKDGKIEIKSQGPITVGGVGKYPATGILTVQACASADGLVISVVSGASLTTPVPSGPVTICHIPPGNPARARTTTVDAAALSAHLGHGDTLGPCK
jgi:hypothetical protein